MHLVTARPVRPGECMYRKVLGPERPAILTRWSVIRQILKCRTSFSSLVSCFHGIQISLYYAVGSGIASLKSTGREDVARQKTNGAHQRLVRVILS